jgi:hypothetical protein
MTCYNPYVHYTESPGQAQPAAALPFWAEQRLTGEGAAPWIVVGNGA